jgi:hypothetical protein
MEQTLTVLLFQTGRVEEAVERAAAELGVGPGDPRAAALVDERIRAAAK